MKFVCTYTLFGMMCSLASAMTMRTETLQYAMAAIANG
jgi:hypothetical protein